MIRINLLKPERKEIKEALVSAPPEYRAPKKQPLPALIFLLLIVIIAALFLFQKKAITNEQSLLRNAQEEKKKLQDVVAKLDQLEQQMNLFKKKIDLIQQLKNRQQTAVRIMDELSKNLPEWVWLTEANFDKQSVQIKGNALSNNLIADYISNLEKSPFFNDVSLLSSTQKSVRNNQFLEFSLTADFVLPSEQASAEEATSREKK